MKKVLLARIALFILGIILLIYAAILNYSLKDVIPDDTGALHRLEMGLKALVLGAVGAAVLLADIIWLIIERVIIKWRERKGD